MSETKGFWWCPVHGLVDSWPCPFCPRVTISAYTDARPLIEAGIQACLDAHRRSIEARLHDQRSAVARMISEITQELRDEIGVMKARIADQDAQLEREQRLSADLRVLASAVSDTALMQQRQIADLRKRLELTTEDLSIASSRQDKKIRALELATDTSGPIITPLGEQP